MDDEHDLPSALAPSGSPPRPMHPDWVALGVHPSELLEDDAAPFVMPVRWGAPAHDDMVWITVAVIEPMEDDAWLRPSAWAWWTSVNDQTLTSAFQLGALDWNFTLPTWGVVLELAFLTDEQAERFQRGSAMKAAIDQLGALRLEVTSGRGGGTSTARVPRRPRPLIGSGAAALPLPGLAEPDTTVGTSQPASW